MDAAKLLSYLERQGILLSLAGDGDRIRLEGPENVLMPEVTEAVRQAKPQLITPLQKRQAAVG